MYYKVSYIVCLKYRTTKKNTVILFSLSTTLFYIFFQTQSHKVLSVCREESPNHTFRFKHVTRRPEEISCTFRISQANCKFDTPDDISLSLHFKSEVINYFWLVSFNE